MLRDQLRQVSARQVAHTALWTLPSWALEAAMILVAAKALGVEFSISMLPYVKDTGSTQTTFTNTDSPTRC